MRVLAWAWGCVVPVGTVSSAAAPGTLRSQHGQGQPSGCEFQSRSLGRGCWGWRTGPCPPRSPVALITALRLPLPALGDFSPVPTCCQPRGGRTGSGLPTLLTHFPKSQCSHPSGQEGCLPHLAAETAPQHPHSEAREAAESGSLLAVLVAPGNWPHGPRGAAVSGGAGQGASDPGLSGAQSGPVSLVAGPGRPPCCSLAQSWDSGTSCPP